ncbi:MAG: T9SS type A sorting domain-containing protein, partial [Ignavibacteriaceae bacterium]
NHTVQFNASSLASGIYLYRIQAGSFIQTKKMILLK